MRLNPPPRSPRQLARQAKTSVRIRNGAVLGATPFLDAATLEVFTRELAGKGLIIEYGSGASTLLAAQRAEQVISVETDRRYAAAVQAAADAAGAHVRVVHVDIGVVGEWGVPASKTATTRRLLKWSRYPHAPWELLASRNLPLPGFVLVDGRFRVASAAASLLRLAATPQTRVLVDDYQVRPEYWAIEAVADVVERAGRSVLFAPRDGQEERLQLMVQEYQDDWR
jgi:hypothetical protein